jgi:hypothetical protein
VIVAKPSGSKPSRKPAPAPGRQGRSGDATETSAEKRDARAVEFLPPLKPRPKLLLALAAAFALWLAVLLVLRFTTVTSHGQERHPHDEPAQKQPVEGAVSR